MKLVLVLLSGIVVSSNVGYAGAQNIYKCEGANGMELRDTPCATNQEGGAVISARKVNWETATNQRWNPRLATMPLAARELHIGMTDTQVLNLPRWGRPARIARTKDAHTWRERCKYERESAGEDGRVLYFENGLLVKQEDPLPLASIEARATME